MKPVLVIAPLPLSRDTYPHGDAPTTERARRTSALMPRGRVAEAAACVREAGRMLAPDNVADGSRRRAGRQPFTGVLAGLRAVCLALLLGAPPAFAHEGHDHAAEAPPPAADAQRRLADGRVRLAKPAQRSWQLRTRIAAR